jgi:hypothetical protein
MNWKPIVTGDLATSVIEAAQDVAKRVSSPQVVQQAAAAAVAQTSFPKSTHWLSYSVAQGYAGLALLSSYMDSCFPNQGWDVVGRQHLELAARDAETGYALPPGIYSGLSGLAFAAWQSSRGGVRYKRLLASLDQAIVPQAMQVAAGLRAETDGVHIGDFDAISGLSGVGAYLLCRRADPTVSAALGHVITALVELLSEGPVLPRWHTPFRLLWDDDLRKNYPHGNLNCGLAHGLPGILAFLALALTLGCEVPGLEEAVAHSARWLAANRFDDQWGINWPTAIAVIEEETAAGPVLRSSRASDAHDGPSRCAWCYGSPGIARSLWLAGEALHDEDVRQLAVAAMEAVFRRPVSARKIDSATFCHGKAGLLQIALRFANDTGCQSFVTESETLVREVMAMYQPESLLGFRNIERDDHEIDQPGLLDGAPGVALTLLAAANAAVPDWDRLFLLS